MTNNSPAFPPELERRIFETCAWNYRATSLDLVLVERRVRVWYVFVLMYRKALTLSVSSGLIRSYLKP